MSEIVDRVEAGASITLTRRGKSVALITAIVQPRRPIDLEMLRALTSIAAESPAPESMIRSMRDDDRY